MDKNSKTLKRQSLDWGLALSAGILLSVMTHLNSLMAKHSTPLFASWLTHAVGTVAALIFALVIPVLFNTKIITPKVSTKIPFWSYLGGIAGGLTVILAAITVNGALGLAPTLALALVGQILFGLMCDLFGFLGVPRRKFATNDVYVLLSVLSGSGIILFMRS